ncbi:hypothetical protein [Nocardia wallacei]|uniref:hypothetical protein n=1 Tax=Nocardia wallacei TaxID=480035 RepID=UPI002454FA4D|nr:hypothetical protein [Nocardia wallacei]
MTVTVQKYRHPTTGYVVEAIRFTEDAMEAISAWLPADKHIFVASPGRISLHVDTAEGTSVAHLGDWVIRDLCGELNVRSAEVFRYEPMGAE